MKTDSRGMTEYLTLPVAEAEKTIEAMKLAEQVGDVVALRWCARRIIWLHDAAAEVMAGDDCLYPVNLFNKAWAESLKNNPPPESIAAIIARIDDPEGITAADAGEALDAVKAY
jgi:hypothetical protein